MKKGYVRLSIYIPKKEYLQFKKVCQASDKSMSEVLRYAISGIIEGFTPKVQVKTPDDHDAS